MALDFSMITTKGGDSGKSSLFGGERRLKSEAVFDILGDTDELVSAMGLARVSLGTSPLGTELRNFQRTLQELSALIATPVSSLNKVKPLGRDEDHWVKQLKKELIHLEQREQHYMGHIKLTGFIIPGDTEPGSRLDIARTICRRVERRLVAYMQQLDTEYFRLCQNYFNRMSDYLFVIARFIEQNPQSPELRIE